MTAGDNVRIWQTENAPADQSNARMTYNAQPQTSSQPSQPRMIAHATPRQYTGHDATPKASDFARYQPTYGSTSDAIQYLTHQVFQ